MEVDIQDAENHLDFYVNQLENCGQSEIVITRSGVPVVKLVRVVPQVSHERIGVAAGKFGVPDDFGSLDNVIAESF